MADVVISGGRVIDGLGLDAVADVAIERGRIAAVGRSLGKARATIDARDSYADVDDLTQLVRARSRGLSTRATFAATPTASLVPLTSRSRLDADGGAGLPRPWDDAANVAGHDVAVDVCPYTAGSTTDLTLLPAEDLAGGEVDLERLEGTSVVQRSRDVPDWLRARPLRRRAGHCRRCSDGCASRVCAESERLHRRQRRRSTEESHADQWIILPVTNIPGKVLTRRAP